MNSLAAKFVDYGKSLAFFPVGIASPSQDQVLIKLEYSGVTDFDLLVIKRESKLKPKLPLILGSTGVGWIINAGSNVKNLEIGDRVCMSLFLRDAQISFESQLETIMSNDGTFSEYIVTNPSICVRIPDGFAFLQAIPVVCTYPSIFRALKETKVTDGQWILINGYPEDDLERLVIQYANLMGMNVIGVGSEEDRTEFLKSAGCKFVLDLEQKNAVTTVKNVTGEGVHAVLLGPLKSKYLDDIMKCIRTSGLFVKMEPAKYSWKSCNSSPKNAEAEGCYGGTREELKEILDLAVSGNIQCNLKVYGFKEINDCLEDLEKGKIMTGMIAIDLSKLPGSN